MARRKREPIVDTIERPPAMTMEERERVLMGYAMDLAERQLRDGSASSQTLNHFLQMADTTRDLRTERIRQQTNLYAMKVDAIKNSQQNDERAANAVAALKRYSGRFGLEEITDGELF